MDPKILEEKLAKIKLLVMDVDGTLTDGKVYYSKNGEELKVFSIRDGMGIELLKKGNIEVAIMTSETTEIVTARANKLKINNVILGSHNKKRDLLTLADKLGISIDCIAFIGDDINDKQAIEIAGIGACPKNSTSSILEVADLVCTKDGGDGAVRELAELILLSQNKQITLPENW